MRVGLLGGTFDPPHTGHLILAEMAAEALALDAVWFVPAGDPPHKQDAAISPGEQRLAMLRLAIDNNPRFTISYLDLARSGPHYSADLVALARVREPDAVWWFVMGGDSLRDLPTWHDPSRLIAQCRLGVLGRPGADFDLARLESAVPGLRAQVDLIDGPSVALSGTLIRERVRAGLSIRYLVPDRVGYYIAAHGLYAGSS